MGLFWDLIQQSQISDQKERSADLQTRVDRLEADVQHTRQVLKALVVRLEEHFGEDINRDGRVGP